MPKGGANEAEDDKDHVLCLTSAMITYNLALVYHLHGAPRKAETLYTVAYNIVVNFESPQQHPQEDQQQLTPLMMMPYLLRLAICNNMGRLAALVGDLSTMLHYCAFLGELLHMPQEDEVDEEDIAEIGEERLLMLMPEAEQGFFRLSHLLAHVYTLGPAPAA